MRKLGVWFLGVVFAVSMVSCDSNQVYDQYKSIPEAWSKDSLVEFEIKNLDSLQTYNLFFNVRNSSAYKYNNLFLISNMKFPNGKQVTDTLEYEMAYPNGKFMGAGAGEIKENKLWYKEKVRFLEEGTYTVTLEQAMRENGEVEGIQQLEGILEVGFRIEKTTHNTHKSGKNTVK
ncbi:gliding motility lipoprotein GldH [Mesonia sp. MT50]|uniref:Gliding motility lipoprotein GldH n=1 Tax=Mesonia profundi TaxID=3070998 RepID=A0ABU1A189_9FLAO|nr:gliding motility lipoprotein GldH [Mesonia profundi]MDQ7916644.1 gliding motility lipoprotein GldH [Mesonia profundi]